MIQHWKNLGKLPRSCWYLALAVLINRAGTMVLPFMTLYLTKHQGLKPVDAGLILTTFGFGALFAAPLSGKLADRFGNVIVMQGSLILTCVLLLIFPLLKSFPFLLGGNFIFALFNESFRPASMATIASLVPSSSRKQAFVLIRLAINLGMSIGPAIGGVLVAFSYHWIFLVDAATAALAAFILTFWLKDSINKDSKTNQTEDPNQTDEKNSVSKSAYTDPLMLTFVLAMLINAIILFQFDSTMPLYVVNELGMLPFQYGLLVSVNTICILFFEVSLNHWTANWPLRRSLMLSTFLWGVGYGALIFAHQFWSVAITVLIWTVGEMIGSPAQSSFVAEIAPKKRLGEYMGFFTMTYGLGYVVAPLVGTQLMQHWGSRTLWMTMFFLGIMSTLLALRIRTQR